MHEMALTEGVLRVLDEQASVHGFTRVKTVWLEIGELSAVEPESMVFCLGAISRGTIAEGARIEVVAVPGQAVCMDCAATVAVRRRYDPCPQCGSHVLHVTAGDQMRIKELEVE